MVFVFLIMLTFFVWAGDVRYTVSDYNVVSTIRLEDGERSEVGLYAFNKGSSFGTVPMVSNVLGVGDSIVIDNLNIRVTITITKDSIISVVEDVITRYLAFIDSFVITDFKISRGDSILYDLVKSECNITSDDMYIIRGSGKVVLVSKRVDKSRSPEVFIDLGRSMVLRGGDSLDVRYAFYVRYEDWTSLEVTDIVNCSSRKGVGFTGLYNLQGRRSGVGKFVVVDKVNGKRFFMLKDLKGIGGL